MAMKFVTACAVVVSFAQLTDAACDAGNIAGGMTKCQMKMSGGGDVCSRFAAYTKCMENLLGGCPSSVTTMYSGFMEKAKKQYAPQLTSCSSSSPSESGSQNEKPSVSKSNSGSNDNNPGTSCTSADLAARSGSCIQKMTTAAQGGNTCGAWNTYECCLKEAFGSCGSDMQGKISTMMSSMQKQYDAILPGLSKCASATCSSGSSPSPTPAEVETTLMANIEIPDPLAFNLDKYIEAVKKATGVAQLPVAVVKAFEIIVKYMLPDATDIAKATAAIAKANGVAEDQVKVTQSNSRRLGAGRRLANSFDVTITVADKEKAAAVQTSAAKTDALGSELGGTVSVAKAPVATVKVETKVKSAPSAANQLASQIESAGSDVGGTIKAEVQAAAPQPSSNGAASNFSIVLAAIVILLRAAF